MKCHFFKKFFDNRGNSKRILIWYYKFWDPSNYSLDQTEWKIRNSNIKELSLTLSIEIS